MVERKNNNFKEGWGKEIHKLNGITQFPHERIQ